MPPQRGSDRFFFRSLISSGARRNPATCSANLGYRKRRFGHLEVADDAAAEGVAQPGPAVRHVCARPDLPHAVDDLR